MPLAGQFGESVMTGPPGAPPPLQKEALNQDEPTSTSVGSMPSFTS